MTLILGIRLLQVRVAASKSLKRPQFCLPLDYPVDEHDQE
jgi:hypothetical protein